MIVSAAVIVVLVGSYWLFPDYKGFVDEMFTVLTSDDPERIEAWVEDFGWIGPALIIVLMTAQMFLIVIPSWILMVIAVLAYGQLWGTLISVGAVLLASTVGYFIGSAVGTHTVSKLLGEKTERRVRIEACRYGTWAVIISRLSPLFSNDAISFVGGLLKMGYLRFILATLAGILPLALLIAVFGEDASSMKTGLIWISIISLLGLVAKIIYDKRKAKRSDDKCEKQADSAMAESD